MNVLVTGATGFVGGHLLPLLKQSGHSVKTVSRRSGDHDWSDASLSQGVQWADAVIHLAGENIAGKRWSAKQKAELMRSRTETTSKLAALVAEHKPGCFVSASAIGWYGPRDAARVDERTPAGEGFLAELCVAWEAATAAARDAGVPTCSVRVGIVLGPDGGALKKMLLPFKLGLGGPLGMGRQGMSWVHVDDLARLFLWIIEDPSRCNGVYNGTAPNPVSNRDYSTTLGRVLRRPAFMPAPPPALKLLLGEMSEMLLTGQYVLPRRATEAGFEFKYPELEGALRELLQ